MNLSQKGEGKGIHLGFHFKPVFHRKYLAWSRKSDDLEKILGHFTLAQLGG